MAKQGQIKAIMERMTGHLQANKDLGKKLRSFRTDFASKNQDHISFFGGNLTGVNVVRFSPYDRDVFFNEICSIEEDELYDELCEADAINPAWQVSSDAFNHLCMWLIHLFLTSPKLDNRAKVAGAVEAATIVYYKFITSILFHFFKYPVDEQVAKAVYAQMSNRYSIKQLGTWNKVIEDKVMKLIDKKSIHYKTLMNYDDDQAIIYLINDTQGRIKDLIKNIYAIFDKVRKQGIKIGTNSMLIDMGDDIIMKDKINGLQAYIRYMETIVPDKNSFIKKEIMDIVCDIQYTAPPQVLEKVLYWCSANYNYMKDDKIKNLVEKTLLHAFTYMKNNSTVYKKNTDLPKLISKLKGIYSSSRSTDPALLEIRALAEDIIKDAKVTKSNVVVSSVRNALLLYIVIRAFTMHYFNRS